MWDRLKENRGEGGFTLIELLIVIIILAILAAIVVFAVGTTTKNASISSCKSDAKSLETAIEAFKAAPGNLSAYPTPGSAGPTVAGYYTPVVGAGSFLRSPLGTSHYTVWWDTSGHVFIGPAGSTTTTYNAGTNDFDVTTYDACSTNAS